MEIKDGKSLAAAFKTTGRSKSGLAEKLGLRNSAITEMLNDERRIQLHEKPKIEEYFGFDNTVPIVGIVRAGGEAVYPESANLGRAMHIPGAGPNTVAVEIEGKSLGAEFDGWIAYYDDIHDPPPASFIGHLCVVSLKDGRIVVKTLKAGKRGRFHLTSSHSETITDVQVLWAARVIDIKPRDLAVK